MIGESEKCWTNEWEISVGSKASGSWQKDKRWWSEKQEGRILLGVIQFHNSNQRINPLVFYCILLLIFLGGAFLCLYKKVVC